MCVWTVEYGLLLLSEWSKTCKCNYVERMRRKNNDYDTMCVCVYKRNNWRFTDSNAYTHTTYGCYWSYHYIQIYRSHCVHFSLLRSIKCVAADQLIVNILCDKIAANKDDQTMKQMPFDCRSDLWCFVKWPRHCDSCVHCALAQRQCMNTHGGMCEPNTRWHSKR